MTIARTALRIAALLAVAGAGAASADTITLLPSVRVVPGAEITLADVAELDGSAARALGATVVGRGETGAFELGAERIRQRLVVAGGDLKVLEFVGNRTVVRPLRGATATDAAEAAKPTSMERADDAAPVAAGGLRLIDPAEHIGRGDALAIICEMVANAFGADARDLRLECSAEQLAKIAPKPGFRYEVARKSLLRTSRVELEVTARHADGDEFRTRVRVTPRLARDVLVARADARRGATSNDDTLAIERRMLTLDEAEKAADPASREGATLARSIARGAVVSRTDLARAAEIKRRETVTVRREIGSIVIELEAVALEDGAVGDVIAFERVDGRNRSRNARSFTAEVVGPGRAVIR